MAPWCHFIRFVSLKRNTLAVFIPYGNMLLVGLCDPLVFFVSDASFWPRFFLQIEFPAQLPCLLHIAMCSAVCNESILQYNPDRGIYEKIGESTEVALRVLAEKVCCCSWAFYKAARHYHSYSLFSFPPFSNYDLPSSPF
jgi:hypothetical protein